MPAPVEELLATFIALEGTPRLRAILDSQLVDTATGGLARALGELALRAGPVDRESLDLLATILGALDRSEPLCVLESPKPDLEADTFSWSRNLVDPASLEVALALDVPLRHPTGNVRTYVFSLYRWHQRGASLAEDQLTRVAAHPYFGQVLEASVFPTRETRTIVGPWLELATRVPAFARVFAALDAYAATVLETYTLGAFAIHEPWLAALCQPRVRAQCPSAVTMVEALTATRLLRNQLRGGLMDEWMPGGGDAATKLPDHPWLASRGELVDQNFGSYVCTVPAAPGIGPFGPCEGLGGFAVTRHHGVAVSESLEGRRFEGTVNGKHVAQLMTFPARDGLYPVIDLALHGIAMPDGHTPLIPAGANKGPYWSAPLDSLIEWYVLRPRDLASSHAIAACTDDSAAALIAASQAPAIARETVMTFPGLQAVFTPAPAPIAAPTRAFEATLTHVLPAVTDPVLRASIAAMAQLAVATSAKIERLQSVLLAGAAPESRLDTTALRSVARLFDHEMPWWVEREGTLVGQQILDTAHYLFESAEPRWVTPARTGFPWPLLLGRVGELLYRVLAPGTGRARRAEFITLLELWLASGFPDHVARLRTLVLDVDPAVVPGLDHQHPHRLVTWNERYAIHYLDDHEGRTRVSAIALTDEPPPGATVVSSEPAAPVDSAAIREVLALVATRGPIPFEAGISEAVAAQTGLGVAAATLVWTAGYDPWLASAQKRAQFGLDLHTLRVAERELVPLRLRELYAMAMPTDPRALYSPTVLAQRISDAFATRLAPK